MLDPIKALDKIESELKATVIASNPAMLWRTSLSKASGMKYPANGYGPFCCAAVAGNGRATSELSGGNFVHHWIVLPLATLAGEGRVRGPTLTFSLAGPFTIFATFSSAPT